MSTNPAVSEDTLAALTRQARRALAAAEGDSNDSEISAWRTLAEDALSALGLDLYSIAERSEALDDEDDHRVVSEALEPGFVTAGGGPDDSFDIMPWLEGSSDEELMVLATQDGDSREARELIALARDLADTPPAPAGIDEIHLLAWICAARPHLRERLVRDVESFRTHPDMLDDTISYAHREWREAAEAAGSD